jgi:CubicO group peptidase (beta-lactamase class C family)
MADAQARVQALIDDFVGRDIERGLQVAAYHNGELVVDAWAGVADARDGRKVDGDTLFGIFSCGKGVTATVIHLLVERGLLDYDTPIFTYWPEFAQNGKAAVTVRHALTHESGIPQIPDGFGPAEMCDWERVVRAVGELKPLWEPGTAPGYHAITYGWILGELARRVDGRPFDQIVQDEIRRPLGLQSLYFGIPDAVEPRIAWLENGPPLEGAPEPLPFRILAIPPSCEPLSDWSNRADIRRACIPGGNAISTVRDLARHYAALARAVEGPEILSDATIRAATTLQTEAYDVVLGPGSRKALGYGIGGAPFSSLGTRSTAFGHGGAGGSIGFADPEHHFAFALSKTRHVAAIPGEDAAYLVATETRRALGIPD